MSWCPLAFDGRPVFALSIGDPWVGWTVVSRTFFGSRGYGVDLNVGQSKFRCDLAVRCSSDSLYQLGILVDTDAHYANPNLLDRYLMQPSILRAFGWRFALVLTKVARAGRYTTRGPWRRTASKPRASMARRY